MALTRWEQETVVNYNNEEKTAIIYTADPIVIRKLDNLVEKYPNEYKCVKSDEVSKTYECSKKYIQFRTPRILTEEQKKACRERLAKVSKHNN